MLMRAKRAIAMTTAAAMAVTAVGLTPAMSAPGAAAPKQVQAAVDTASDNYVEVAQRRRHRQYRGGNGGAAALGAFAAIAGTIATLAARDRYERRRYYEPSPYGYGYYGAPAPYGYYDQYYAPRHRYYQNW